MFIFLPFSDENPTVRKPVVTWALIGINLIVFIFQMLLSPQSNQLLIDSFGVRPSAFFELVKEARDYITKIENEIDEEAKKLNIT